MWQTRAFSFTHTHVHADVYAPKMLLKENPATAWAALNGAVTPPPSLDEGCRGKRCTFSDMGDWARSVWIAALLPRLERVHGLSAPETKRPEQQNHHTTVPEEFSAQWPVGSHHPSATAQIWLCF